MYPLPVFIVLSAISMAAQVHRLTADAFVFFILDSVVFGLVGGSVLWSSRRWLPNFSRRYVGYFATILVAANLAVLGRVFQGALIDYEGVSRVSEFGVFAVRVFILICLVQAVLGIFERRIGQQVIATQRALAVVEQQSEALLQADEEIRGSVAALLHDRVQGGLLAACLRLRRSAEESYEQSTADVSQVISELEQLRTIDVRRAVRALSPNLSELDLEAVLNELADAYRPAVDISVRLNLDSRPEPQLALGVYRISEQALMN
jgi:signal transduction histidine kinase